MGNNNNEAFYIGWVGKAPATLAAFVKKYVLFLLPTGIAVAFLLAMAQKKFGTGNFEFGTLTQVTGVYFDKPVPCLTVTAGTDVWGKPAYVTVPLIGYGKFWAEGVLTEMEKTKGVTLNNKQVTMRGTLLYNDGKVFMQIDGNDNPVTNVAENKHPMPTAQPVDIGRILVKGEIVDPKCYFGVMKPGEGKPHEDCAIRCILGGMPPMLHVVDRNGRSNYYFIVGTGGDKINNSLKNYIAKPVEIKAKAVQFNDLVVLYTNASQSITAISKSAMLQPQGSMVACAAMRMPVTTTASGIK